MTRLWTRLFWLDVTVHLVTLALGFPSEGWGVVRVTQSLLMPLLLLDFLARTRGRPAPRRGWVASALVWCFVGDTLPALVPEPWAMLALIAPFAVAQACFIVALRPWRRRTPRLAKLSYFAVFVVMLSLCLPTAGGLVVPVIAYAALLATMGRRSAAHSHRAGLGGALFVFSDSLIALGSFRPDLVAPGSVDVAIMVTYIAACWLLARAFASRTR